MASRTAIVRSVSALSAPAIRCRGAAVRPQWRNCAAVWRAQRRGFAAAGALREKLYTEDHEWVEQTGDTCTLGITTYAAKALGDVVYAELPEVGAEVSSGDAIGAVESVKSASDILTPITGEVVEVNGTLEEKPGEINNDPEGGAWIAKIRVEGDLVAGEGHGVTLLSKSDYDEFVGTQEEPES